MSTEHPIKQEPVSAVAINLKRGASSDSIPETKRPRTDITLLDSEDLGLTIDLSPPRSPRRIVSPHIPSRRATRVRRTINSNPSNPASVPPSSNLSMRQSVRLPNHDTAHRIEMMKRNHAADIQKLQDTISEWENRHENLELRMQLMTREQLRLEQQVADNSRLIRNLTGDLTGQLKKAKKDEAKLAIDMMQVMLKHTPNFGSDNEDMET